MLISEPFYKTIFMKLETIKKAVASLPHVKTVWVEGSNIYIHEKKGVEKIDLETIAAQPIEPVEPSAPSEPIAQPIEPVEEAKSTNKKK